MEAKKKAVWLKIELFPYWKAIPGRDRRWCSNSTRGTAITHHTSNGSVTTKVEMKKTQPTNQPQEKNETATQPQGEMFSLPKLRVCHSSLCFKFCSVKATHARQYLPAVHCQFTMQPAAIVNVSPGIKKQFCTRLRVKMASGCAHAPTCLWTVGYCWWGNDSEESHGLTAGSGLMKTRMSSLQLRRDLMVLQQLNSDLLYEARRDKWADQASNLASMF